MTEEPERAAAGRAWSSGEKDERERDPNFPDGTLGSASGAIYMAVSNLRGFFGAFSDRSDLGEIDPALELEDIVVGLLQPHAPAEARVVKLVVRILQSPQIDAKRLWFRARRERADATLAWLIELVPLEEQRGVIVELQRELRARPPRDTRRPAVRYDPRRLVPRKASRP